jgi:hypothetical protein
MAELHRIRILSETELLLAKLWTDLALDPGAGQLEIHPANPISPR